MTHPLLSHPRLARLADALARRPGALASPDGPVRYAAVLLMLRATATPELLMIRRAEFEGDPWSGHVALPGGRREAGDATLEDTALRETREEIAIDVRAAGGLVLGTLDEVHPRTPALPPIVVRPYVAVVPPNVTPVPSPEVAQAFWVPLATLEDPQSSGEATVVVRGAGLRVSCFWCGDEREHLVWGLTERILRRFLEVLRE